MPDEITVKYIDVITGHLHRNLNTLFQIEANYMMLEKDHGVLAKMVSDLQTELAVTKAELEETQNSRASDSGLQEKIDSLQSKLDGALVEKENFEKKASHIDTFSAQIGALNQQINIKDQFILEQTKKIEDLERNLSDKTLKISELEARTLKNSIPPVSTGSVKGSSLGTQSFNEAKSEKKNRK